MHRYLFTDKHFSLSLSLSLSLSARNYATGIFTRACLQKFSPHAFSSFIKFHSLVFVSSLKAGENFFVKKKRKKKEKTTS